MIYIFKCINCKTVFNTELTLEEYEKNNIRCPVKKCNSRELKRIYYDVPVIFKGEGFTKSNNEGE